MKKPLKLAPGTWVKVRDGGIGPWRPGVVISCAPDLNRAGPDVDTIHIEYLTPKGVMECHSDARYAHPRIKRWRFKED